MVVCNKVPIIMTGAELEKWHTEQGELPVQFFCASKECQILIWITAQCMPMIVKQDRS
jgi:hypothetical protein